MKGLYGLKPRHVMASIKTATIEPMKTSGVLPNGVIIGMKIVTIKSMRRPISTATSFLACIEVVAVIASNFVKTEAGALA